MQIIHLETKIAAPPERCFLLSLSIDLHMASTAPTRELAIAGRTHGVIGPDETVTWRGRHFGLMLSHTSHIDRYDLPRYFRDVMTQGIFSRFEHEHFFVATPNGNTLMRDELRFAAPLGPLGRLAETLVLRRYLARFLKQRNSMIQCVAEGPTDVWQQYLADSLITRKQGL